MIDILDEVVRILNKNKKLIKMLSVSKEDKRYKAVYQTYAPFAEEFPRIIIHDLSSSPIGFYDNCPKFTEIAVQVSIFTKRKAPSFALVCEVIKTLSDKGFKLYDNPNIMTEFDKDEMIFHKPLRFEITKKLN